MYTIVHVLAFWQVQHAVNKRTWRWWWRWWWWCGELREETTQWLDSARYLHHHHHRHQQQQQQQQQPAQLRLGYAKCCSMSSCLTSCSIILNRAIVGRSRERALRFQSFGDWFMLTQRTLCTIGLDLLCGFPYRKPRYRLHSVFLSVCLSVCLSIVCLAEMSSSPKIDEKDAITSNGDGWIRFEIKR